MPDRTVLAAQGATAAPFAYTVPTADGMTPKSVFAQWDGTNAAGDFLPCVSYYDQHGILLYRAFPDGVNLTTGDTADVSYGPFRRGAGTGGTGGGIQFGVNNVGSFLDITTTLAGVTVTVDSGGIDLTVLGVSNANLVSVGGDARVSAAGTATLESDTDTVVTAVNGDLTMRSRNGITTVRGDTLILRADGNVFMPNLPILDPGITGALWNNGGFVAVSP